MASTMREIPDEAGLGLRLDAYGAGRWIGSDRRIAVTDPADDSLIGEVAAVDPAIVDEVVNAASAAWAPWRRLLARERADILCRWSRLIGDDRERLARIMTREQGKPLAEARGEIDYARSFIDWFAAEAQRHHGDVVPSHIPGARLFTLREPVGIVAAITPWNFPSAMVTRKAAAALAAGCPVVVVPSVETPFSALALAELAIAAGMPAGIFSVLTGDNADIVRALCAREEVRALSFTGSTDVGRVLMRQAADTVKKVSLELGGHAPFIVLPDADIESAVAGCIKAKYTTGGQDCLGANRIFVHGDIYETFAEQFVAASAALTVGPGVRDDVAIGPLMNDATVAKCQAHVRDALAHGASLLLDGGVQQAGTRFYHPTVIGDVTSSMAIWREETFGPVAPLVRFESRDALIEAANDSEYGLAAYVYSKDTAAAWRLAEALEFGLVALNTAKMTGPPVPFGGYKQSGLGREGAACGLDEFSEIKYLCWNHEE